MGLFKSDYKPLNYELVKEYLKEKDGKIHSVFITYEEKQISNDHIRSFSDILEGITSDMQDAGYEILDLKPTTAYGPIISGNTSHLTFSTLIVYK